MIPIEEYPAISEEVFLDRAAHMLIENYRDKGGTWLGYESLLVTNKDGEIVGFLSLRSFLKAIGLCDPGNDNWFLDLVFSRRRISNSTWRVKNFMCPLDGRTVRVNDNLDQVIRIMMKNQVDSVMVVDGDKAVGVIRVIDLLWFMEELL
jgi:CBS domain-containing protein